MFARPFFLKETTGANLVVLLLMLFFFPGILPAQKGSTDTLVKPKKSSRVFYGQASFYANKFQGRKTANGEIFDQKKLTCACNVLPLGTWVKVTNLRNGKSAIVKVNDRIHPRMRRVVDLSRAAAQKLGFISRGLTRVKVEVIDKKNIP
jgi:rare lipoprotein A